MTWFLYIHVYLLKCIISCYSNRNQKISLSQKSQPCKISLYPKSVGCDKWIIMTWFFEIPIVINPQTKFQVAASTSYKNLYPSLTGAGGYVCMYAMITWFICMNEKQHYAPAITPMAGRGWGREGGGIISLTICLVHVSTNNIHLSVSVCVNDLWFSFKGSLLTYLITVPSVLYFNAWFQNV